MMGGGEQGPVGVLLSWYANCQFFWLIIVAVVIPSLSRVLLFETPMNCSTPDFLVFHNLLDFDKTHVHWVDDESVMPSNHLILCCPLFHLPSIFPSIRVFSNELVIFIAWPKYWGLSFSISLSNEYSGLISFSIYRFDLPEVQGTFKSPFQHHSLKTSILTGRLTGEKKTKQFDSYAPRSPGNRIPPKCAK